MVAAWSLVRVVRGKGVMAKRVKNAWHNTVDRGIILYRLELRVERFVFVGSANEYDTIEPIIIKIGKKNKRKCEIRRNTTWRRNSC